jgi:DNA-binding GntR family transcriptional regulator
MSAEPGTPQGGTIELMADRAYAALRDRIVSLRIAPGAPINEDALGRELDMGRTPVREAIKRLALENLVTVFPRRGTFASEINITDLAHISDVRGQLEGHAAYRAAERLTAAQRAELGDLLERIDARDGAPAADLMGLDADIHRFVYRCAANPYLEETLGRYFNLSLRIWHLVLDRLPHLTDRVSEHRALLEAVRAGDAEAARHVAAEHVGRFAHEIRSVL